MGTRNLTAVYHDGKYKIAQYGQCDGYPSGQGITALEFLRSCDFNKLKEKLNNCYQPDDQQIKQWWIDAGHDGVGEFVSMDVSDKFKENYPSMSRDIGAGILELVYKSEKQVPLRMRIDFAKDSLFCEYAYVVDFDKSTFEVYSGFNRKPLKDGERFFDSEKKHDEYYPVKLWHVFDLNRLPSNDVFLTILKEDEE